ncbi:MAG: bifunctional precorrin-2 dehydrogenase/sirohydrochlorin ferrochelatase [Candidatus Omnitrophica bacterium]|nr:bifunctional precorrin-2 dehydrogenase/sirohydrochlorin ferrochelatase [Candidatus Omnitrophota bacterium]
MQKQSMALTGYYPVSLLVKHKPCVIVGGGVVAQRKVETLLRYGAKIAVISPEARPALAQLTKSGKIRWLRRSFRATDLRGAWLVYACTDDHHVNAAVFRAAQRHRVLANIVDVPELCTFIATSQVKRGGLVFSITTSGGSPALAKRVRQEVERVFGPEYGRFLSFLNRLRPSVMRRIATPAARKRVFTRLARRDDILELLKRGRTQQARARAEHLIAQASNHGG